MIKKAVIIFLALGSAGIILLSLFILSIHFGGFGHLPTKRELVRYQNKTATLVLADKGELIGKIFAQNRTNNQ